eukprot:7299620-Ditylum_brightwellii.AAC.1
MDNSDDSKAYIPTNQSVGPAERKVYSLQSRNKNDSEAYTPINPNVGPAERRVYNLQSRTKKIATICHTIWTRKILIM